MDITKQLENTQITKFSAVKILSNILLRTYKKMRISQCMFINVQAENQSYMQRSNIL